MIFCEGKLLTVGDLRAAYCRVTSKHSRSTVASTKLTFRSKRRSRFPGICLHAQRLGVSRIHLYYVLIGERKSPRIEAYAAEHIRGRR